MASETQTFWWIVLTNPPTLEDFTSHAALGRQPRKVAPEMARLLHGLSVEHSEAGAREQALRLPRLGQFIAKLDLPVGGPVTWDQTTKRPGHHTLWGEPAVIARYVVAVVPVHETR
jgi:hypothetical protein